MPFAEANYSTSNAENDSSLLNEIFVQLLRRRPRIFLPTRFRTMQGNHSLAILLAGGA
jgi:hypothetical protein